MALNNATKLMCHQNKLSNNQNRNVKICTVTMQNFREKIHRKQYKIIFYWQCQNKLANHIRQPIKKKDNFEFKTIGKISWANIE